MIPRGVTRLRLRHPDTRTPDVDGGHQFLGRSVQAVAADLPHLGGAYIIRLFSVKAQRCRLGSLTFALDSFLLTLLPYPASASAGAAPADRSTRSSSSRRRAAAVVVAVVVKAESDVSERNYGNSSLRPVFFSTHT